MDKYIKETPRLSLRRGKNLADLVVNAKKKEGDGGTGPCGKGCKLCGFMVETKEITDKRGDIKKIKGRMDCRTVGAIYGMYCKKCTKIVYVGKTKNRIMERFNGHRQDLKVGDETKPAFHFKKEGHEEEDLQVVALEYVPGEDDIYRVARERWWMNRMGTFEEENRKR